MYYSISIWHIILHMTPQTLAVLLAWAWKGGNLLKLTSQSNPSNSQSIVGSTYCLMMIHKAELQQYCQGSLDVGSLRRTQELIKLTSYFVAYRNYTSVCTDVCCYPTTWNLRWGYSISTVVLCLDIWTWKASQDKYCGTI